MDLRTYLDGLPRGQITVTAGKLGISTVYLHQLAARQDGRFPPPELAVRMEQIMPGVSRRDIRPFDWHLIWPELITDEFPAPLPEPMLEPAARAAGAA